MKSPRIKMQTRRQATLAEIQCDAGITCFEETIGLSI
jgi:hypothetical protein